MAVVIMASISAAGAEPMVMITDQSVI